MRPGFGASGAWAASKRVSLRIEASTSGTAYRAQRQTIFCLRIILVLSYANTAESRVRRQNRKRRLGRLPRRDGLSHGPDPRRYQRSWGRRQYRRHLPKLCLAKEINTEGFFAPRDIRNDGWPKSSARPTQPGVILSFTTKQGRIVMPCDSFKDWEANLRAIALSLERLRAADRYGVTTEEKEQYIGWLRLPATSQTDDLTELASKLIEECA